MSSRPDPTRGPIGRLYLVATPIGNLEDIGLRALRTLGEVGWIAAEDTRHTRKLLSAHGIEAELISYREQNHTSAARRLFARLLGGGDVALVCDAGTPGISDPGQALVAEAVEHGVQVVPIPGACAAVTALACSGLPSDRFVFLGFPPRKAGAFRRLVTGLVDEPGTLVVYESPKRIGKTLKALTEILGARRAVVVREVTKMHETIDRGDLVELAKRYSSGTKGEIVLLVAGAPEATRNPIAGLEDLRPVVEALRSSETLSASQVARLLAPVCGVGRREIYRLAAETDPGENADD